ncbi:hypothetical protein ACWGB8_27710 [Kitasatospora sp. NPDC054939]
MSSCSSLGSATYNPNAATAAADLTACALTQPRQAAVWKVPAEGRSRWSVRMIVPNGHGRSARSLLANPGALSVCIR